MSSAASDAVDEGIASDCESPAVAAGAMQGLNLEFGTDGERSRPVFRPALRTVKTKAKRLPVTNKIIGEAMMSPNTQRWKRWPQRKDRISAKQANEYSGFIKRLGV